MKGQVAGQIFAYIFAIVLVSIILLFGYSAIMKFKKNTEEIEYINMKNELTAAVKKVIADYGSVVKTEVVVPGRYSKVCFVKTYDDLPDASDIPSSYPIIQQSVNSKINDNVFLITDIAERHFDVGKITLNESKNNFLCIKPVGGRLILRIEGKGNHVDISEWR